MTIGEKKMTRNVLESPELSSVLLLTSLVLFLAPSYTSSNLTLSNGFCDVLSTLGIMGTTITFREVLEMKFVIIKIFISNRS